MQMSYFIHWESIRNAISLYDLQFVEIYKYHTYLYAKYKTSGKFYQLINMANAFKYSWRPNNAIGWYLHKALVH